MKKKGFIATSLIYSFFLVFVAILVSIMANYTSTRVQLNRLKQDAKEELDKCSISKTSGPYCD
ncbi:MAG: hypothetical protein IJ574_00790 [Bacilli bacterium]|nr:hypothetical protein [Bacilli bacterium]